MAERGGIPLQQGEAAGLRGRTFMMRGRNQLWGRDGVWGRRFWCWLSLVPGPTQDDQPRALPAPSSSGAAEPAAGMRKKEAAVLLAANFTANNR